MRAFKIVSLVVLGLLVLAACGGGAAAPTSAPPTAAPAQPTAAPAQPTAAPAQPTTAGGATGGELKIAVLAPLSGPVPTFGVSTRDGALQAIKEWNDKGGVLGMKITAVVEDSQCTPDPAVNAANKVIDQDKVHYIIGEVCSKASIPVSRIANQKGVVQISPTSTNPSVTVGDDGKTLPYVFRACFTDDLQGKVEAQFALNTLKAKTAFLLYDQSNDYTVGLSQFFEKAFTAGGGQIVGKETYTSKDTDFSAILAKVAAAKPDVVQLPDYYNVVNLVTKQAKQAGITAPFIGGDGWDSPDLDAQAADGGYFTNHYWPDDPRPEVQQFVKGYGALYKDDKGNPKTPDALAALAYDATNLMLTGIQKAGADDPAKVKDAIAGITFDAVSGQITFDAQHNPVKLVTIVAVKGGKATFYSQVKPE